MTLPRLSICIASYRGLRWLPGCLGSLKRTLPIAGSEPGLDWECLLCDDASEDGTRELIEKEWPWVRCVINPLRQGFARNNNQMAQLARGQILCFLNNDTVVQPGWWQPMLELVEKGPEVGVVGNVQWSPRTGHFDHMGIVFSPEAEPHHFGRHFFFRPYTGVTRWAALTAACWMIRRRVFDENGGFDPTFTNGCEDIDFCLRLGEKGYRHYVANQSVIHHYVGGAPGRKLKERTNERLFAQRWAERLQQTWVREDQRLFAVNYLLRFLSRPWRYNLPRVIRSWRMLCRTALQARSILAPR